MESLGDYSQLSFLRGGSRKLIVKDQSSEGQLINAGDTQGSLLGPALFLLSINDLTMIIIRSFVSIYNDDTTVDGRKSQTLYDQYVAADLFSNLDSTAEWMKKMAGHI